MVLASHLSLFQEANTPFLTLLFSCCFLYRCILLIDQITKNIGPNTLTMEFSPVKSHLLTPFPNRFFS